MAHAITLGLDERSTSRVIDMWRALAAAGISDDALGLGYPPHLTLAVCPGAADTDRLLTATQECVADWRRSPITLASLGWFPGRPAGMFLAPVITAVLLARHAALITALGTENIDPHYQVGHWVPHVTLAKDIADPAVSYPRETLQLPIDAVVDRVEVVRFRPVEVLASFPLT